jgi:hypothetical protein
MPPEPPWYTKVYSLCHRPPRGARKRIIIVPRESNHRRKIMGNAMERVKPRVRFYFEALRPSQQAVLVRLTLWAVSVSKIAEADSTSVSPRLFPAPGGETTWRKASVSATGAVAPPEISEEP